MEDREVALLVLGLLVLGFLLSHWRQLRVLPWWPLLMASASLLVMGWLLTVVEHLGDFPVLNVAEHALYTVHSILLAIWAVRLQKGRVAR